MGCLSATIALCALVGCSKAKAPATAPVTVQLATVITNASGDVLVQLSITNESTSAVLIGVRSAIYRTQDSWMTNFNVHPLITDVARPRYTATEVTLAAGNGVTVKVSPLKVPQPFQLEFVCFPGRTGIDGLVDKTKDKLEQLKDGSQTQSLLGESFFVLSPLIDVQTKPGGAARVGQPIRSE
jgi:hypothetical protein